LVVEDLKRGTNKDIGSKDIFEMDSILSATEKNQIQVLCSRLPETIEPGHSLLAFFASLAWRAAGEASNQLIFQMR